MQIAAACDAAPVTFLPPLRFSTPIRTNGSDRAQPDARGHARCACRLIWVKQTSDERLWPPAGPAIMTLAKTRIDLNEKPVRRPTLICHGGRQMNGKPDARASRNVAALILLCALAACSAEEGSNTSAIAASGASSESARAPEAAHSLRAAGRTRILTPAPACSAYAAVSPTQYAGSGTGVWSVANSGASVTEVPISLSGLNGQTVQLVYSNTSATDIDFTAVHTALAPAPRSRSAFATGRIPGCHERIQAVPTRASRAAP
jgi:hypothetical protein